MFHHSYIFDFCFLAFGQTGLALVPGRKSMGILATCRGSDYLVGTDVLY